MEELEKSIARGETELGELRAKLRSSPGDDWEMLAKMAQEGVLRATRTAKGAWVYEPGPNAAEYRQGAPA